MKIGSKAEIKDKENTKNVPNKIQSRALSIQKTQITKKPDPKGSRLLQNAKSAGKVGSLQQVVQVSSVKKPLFFEKPTAKLKSVKINEPFKSEVEIGNKFSKGFQFYYHNSKIPCKINHGSISNKLIWENGVNLESYLKSNQL